MSTYIVTTEKPYADLQRGEAAQTVQMLSGAAIETLKCLLTNGGVDDGDIPSKTGRNELFKHGLATRTARFGNDLDWLTSATPEGLALWTKVDSWKATMPQRPLSDHHIEQVCVGGTWFLVSPKPIPDQPNQDLLIKFWRGSRVQAFTSDNLNQLDIHECFANNPLTLERMDAALRNVGMRGQDLSRQTRLDLYVRKTS